MLGYLGPWFVFSNLWTMVDIFHFDIHIAIYYWVSINFFLLSNLMHVFHVGNEGSWIFCLKV